MRATYNITNDKLRVWFDERLSADEYAIAKRSGFAWWPGSKCFAAKWSTSAEDFILSHGLTIEEDDAPDNVEARVERFAGYADRAAESAERSQTYLDERANTERRKQNAVNAISRGLSEAEHWQERIEGAIRHAAYKERPDVIARRIKGLETDLRRQQKTHSQATNERAMWDDSRLNLAGALALANYQEIHISRCFTKAEFPLSTYEGAQSLWGALDKGICTLEQAQTIALEILAAVIARAARWIAHIENRLIYEKAMLTAAGVSLEVLTPPRKKRAPVVQSKARNGSVPEVLGAFGASGGFVDKLETARWYLITKVNKTTLEYLTKGSSLNGAGVESPTYSIRKTEIYGLSFLKTPDEVKAQHADLLEDWKKVCEIRERRAAALKAAA